MTRKFILLIVLLVVGSGYTDAMVMKRDTGVYDTTQLRADRLIAAHKQRRIIYNNDGNEPFKLVDSITANGLLRPRFLGIENTLADAYFYCTSDGWSTFSHNTHLGTILTLTDSVSGIFTHNVTADLIAANLDPLKVVTDFGHAHSKEVFWSMRMNDTHDASTTQPYGAVLFNANLIKKAHPEYLLGDSLHKKASWTAVNYSLQAVRDSTLHFIEEVCKNYDVDGIELDFFRHRVFFPSTFLGQVVTSTEIAQMTDLMRKIRHMTEVEGVRRGRPILISMRVPDSKQYAHDIGLDIESWLQEGLLDMMSVSSYIRLNPWKVSVELGHLYNVPVYPSLDEIRIADAGANALRSTSLAYRGRAQEVWNSGADGVYMFNFFDPHSQLWNELGDSTALKDLDKNYFASVLGVGDKAGLNHATYNNIPTLNPDTPIDITATQTKETYFEFGNDPASTGNVRLRLQFKTVPDTNRISVHLGGALLTGVQRDSLWLNYDLKNNDFIKGKDTVKVTLASGTAVKWTDLQVIAQKNVFGLFVDHFDYPADTVISSSGIWKCPTGITPVAGAVPAYVVTPGLTFTGYPAIGNALRLNAGTVQDGILYSASANNKNTEDLYVSMLVKVTKADANNFFFAFAINNNSATFRGKINVTKNVNGKLQFGLSHGAGVIYTGAVYDFNHTYLLVMQNHVVSGIRNDAVRLYVLDSIPLTEPSPTLEFINGTTSTAVVDDKPINAIHLRQIKSQDITVDGIIADNKWPFEDMSSMMLSTFSARNQTNAVQLNWATSGELNSTSFEIQRSADGKNFRWLTQVSGKGANTANSYSYADTEPLRGKSFYRLIPKNVDGKDLKAEDRTVLRNLNQTTFKLYTVRPNELTAEVNTDYAGKARLMIYNLNGKQLAVKEVTLAKGINTIPVAAQLKNGEIGALIFSTAKETINKKFVLTNVN
jgi:hypothetical protein